MGNCQKQEQTISQTNPNNDHLGPVHQIKIINTVWKQDYQGLFDYDTNQVQRKLLKIRGNAILIKNMNKFELVDDNVKNLDEERMKECQFRVLQRDNFYQVRPIIIPNQNFAYTISRILWLIVPSLPNKYYRIKQKDIFKLGKQRICVRQIALQDSNPSNFQQNMRFKNNVYQNLNNRVKNNKDKQSQNLKIKEFKGAVSDDATNSEQVCRICLDPGQFDNPLITPCKCSGSVKYIHYNCLKSWLAKRINVQKTQHCYTINWQTLSCQMCKAPFSYRIYMDDKKFYTVQIPKPSRPYIAIQLMKKNSKQNGKIFHFVSFSNKKKILLGRRKDIDVRLADDISISRTHACIQYNSENKQFYITDNKIKKGILVRPQFKDMSLQIGGEVYTFNSVRGPSKQNFKKQQLINQNQFMVQNFSDDEEEDQLDQNQNDDDLNSSQNELENMQLPPSNNQLLILSEHRQSAGQIQSNN